MDAITIHHLGRTFNLTQIEPPLERPSSRVRAPGAGEVRFDELSVSPLALAPGEAVTVRGALRATSVASVSIELWLVDAGGGRAFGPLAWAPVEPAETRMIGGVGRPAWPEAIRVEQLLRPSWSLLGSGDRLALTAPAPHRAAQVEVRGRHASGEEGTEADARLIVDADGVGSRLLVRARSDRPAPWRPVPAAAGGWFAPVVRVLALGGSAGGPEGTARSDALSISGEPLRLSVVDAAPGRHLAAIRVEDRDGGVHRRVAEFEVRP